MQPRKQDHGTLELFQAHFDQLLNPNHELVQLARKIDWKQFDVAFAECFSPDMGAPAKASRLMVGLHYLKYAFNESDESLIDRWVENPYWQYFCGFTHLQHECPIHPTSMTKWRNRVGADRLQLLLEETITLGRREGFIRAQSLARVNVDTTVQEKNITYPTDSKLLYKAIKKVGEGAKSRGIQLRQSYIRVGKRLSARASRYAHARQFKRMRRCLRKLQTYVGRLIRDIRRKTGDPDAALETLLQRTDRIRQQQPHDTNKLYSLHEPDVQCISKGKAHKRYEFGQKVAIATTNKDNWIVAAQLMQGNPYDGHTLKQTLDAVTTITGTAVTDAYVDKGYRGHGIDGEVNVHVAGQRRKNTSRAERKRRRRRSAVEPKIGHLKSDHRMNRCYLGGLTGDATNAILAAAGSNPRKLLRRFAAALIYRLRFLLHRPEQNDHQTMAA